MVLSQGKKANAAKTAINKEKLLTVFHRHFLKRQTGNGKVKCIDCFQVSNAKVFKLKSLLLVTEVFFDLISFFD